MNDEDLKKIADLISNSEERIISELGSFVNNSILPQLDGKADKEDLYQLATKDDIGRLERKVDSLFEKETQQDNRLNAIESIPSIAHELKLKK